MKKHNHDIPKFQDLVKHIKSPNATGVVIAVYQLYAENKPFMTAFDVRLQDDTILYSTPAENWKTIKSEDDI